VLVVCLLCACCVLVVCLFACTSTSISRLGLEPGFGSREPGIAKISVLGFRFWRDLSTGTTS
jgi:hypothetical protein